ncbi:phosphoenolpyruvate--protein phosphotransferase [Paenibacillus alginolyticus]|uniref:Phosphoenolpyruvate-protein phosphotransferase n=1 Tax=Paenibacillus alginolyticus TaxID=59839 RepID=A0ABT4GJA9_9BACL|nr:phosphoenolpyruvate--protein phosphotransferase [Paenibacillus alginolyticus]MCY9668054.1 phosphoenolpyruvate--protein phosphotransferase [Paenibacillus alginolyticus]MCY9696268.1 phosphoenolpyruvate--protein phosphotransferase [Paenibacillus alginolyticus]MEC0142543.1 phosphoenolpyruvate--protein phosphotransferase [Paenibacillus alginolyticus]
MIRGIGASSGIAMGQAFVIPTWEWDFPEKMIDVTDLSYEFERLYDGIRSSKDELEIIKQEIKDVVGQDQAYIFDAHLAILEDPIFMNEIQGIIELQYKAAEVAVKEVIDKFVDMFNLIDDEYMKERALDIKDVGNRLLKHLLGDTSSTVPPIDHPYILVAKELTPSQLAHLDPANVLGLLTILGGTHSHVSIMARAMSVPYVLSLEGKLLRPIQNGDFLIIDGQEGTLYINPDKITIERYQARKKNWLEFKESLQEIADVAPVTLDKSYVNLHANINSVLEIDQVLRNGASGVGLFRTEYLYMDRDSLPSEDEQYEVYRHAARQLKGRPIVIRTLDIGGDKKLDYLPLAKEDNPFLGYRAIRISLDRKDLFMTQLRAILRASHYGNVKIMYPMVTSLDEVRQAKALLEKAKAELYAQGLPYNANIEVGLTIEVPAAALIADVLASEVNFMSIGTNDLVQYVLAVDRMNENIAHLYNPYHPAVIRLLKHVIDSAKSVGIPVGVCGEMAGDIRALPIWLGLGIEELSISVQTLLQVKHRLLSSDAKKCKQLVNEILVCKTSDEIIELLAQTEQTESIVGGN